MSDLLKSIDQRTRLVGENRLELLMFRLSGRQLFALNVFKIQEVVAMPTLTELPHRHPSVCGVTHLRNQTIAVIDLSVAIGGPPMVKQEKCNLIVTEYNRSVQAFLVGGVERIVNLNWELILPPPQGAGRSHFLTAITRMGDEIVEILDVERVLADIIPYNTSVSDSVKDISLAQQAQETKLQVLLVDDSMTATMQASETLSHLGVEVITATNGLQALNMLKQWSAEGVDINKKLLMVITDAEMPEMDGYRLTAEIRQDPALQNLYVVLHTSLSGNFNRAMVEKVGCDGFLSKFQPDELATVVQDRLRAVLEG